MFPPLLFIGLLMAFTPRGWLAIPVALLAWPMLLLATGTRTGFAFIMGAALVGVLNTAVGFLIGVGVRSLGPRQRAHTA